jgi:hypothetical protein
VGRGNAICPDTSSRSHSIAVESQNPGTAYHTIFPARTSSAIFSGCPRGPRVHVTPRTHRSGCGQNDHPGSLARESCLPFSDKLGTPWLFENGGSVADKMRPIEFQRSLVLCRFIFLKSMPRAELVTAFPARQGVNMLREATFRAASDGRMALRSARVS